MQDRIISSGTSRSGVSTLESGWLAAFVILNLAHAYLQATRRRATRDNGSNRESETLINHKRRMGESERGPEFSSNVIKYHGLRE
ncbi:hypothetical protein CEXT_247911 [Caerostris extrusa]|uniref:Uncharacterized protein n=1 Tax=Caerostris extrusa TaxID=172846 RepID=A0AAV4N636_CAEEX|nr:hypothetical protein CEXT_247911 [Caerostris extrusa]